MSSLVCLLIGCFVGNILTTLTYYNVLSNKDKIIKDLNKSVKFHQQRELKIIYINQLLKEHINKRLFQLKNKKDTKTLTEEKIIITQYIVFKELEKLIIQLEKETEILYK